MCLIFSCRSWTTDISRTPMGRKVDFKQTIIIMTSNAGAQAIIEPKKLGFMSGQDEKQDYERMKSNVMDEVRRLFKPEFLNRIDEIYGIPSAE